MLGLSGLTQTAIAAVPTAAAAPQSPFYLTDYPNPRGYVPASDLRTWVRSVNLNLIGQDNFFGHGGPNYDYPNPRAAPRASDLRTWINQVNLNLLGQDKFFGAGGPNYDYPNPRAPARASDLRTWTLPRNLSLYATAFDLFGHPQYDWPNPRGPLRASDLRTWVWPLNPNLRDKFFGLAGHPNYDQPNPRGYVPAIDLRTWIKQGNIQLGRVVGRPTLAFTRDIAAAIFSGTTVAVFVCTAGDSPSGQNWSGPGYMQQYEIDTSIQIEGIFIDALNGVYVDPTEVQLFVMDPSGDVLLYNSLTSGGVDRIETGHYVFTFVPSESGTWTYKWKGTGVAPATSPDSTFEIFSSSLVAG